jgi:REP element-mobilizing transposase RayT
MDRYWLLTWTTYGTRLPGDARGFVSNVRDDSGQSVRHNVPGTACDADIPRLEEYARKKLKCPPIYLVPEQATALFAQFHETSAYRGWVLHAVAILPNHTHIVAGVPGDPDPADIMGDFKSYGSRALNRRWGKPASGTWWTESGSRRKLPDEQAVSGAIAYVRGQEHPLLIWVADGVQVATTGG